jgi:hypothetical protein
VQLSDDLATEARTALDLPVSHWWASATLPQPRRHFRR